MQYKDAKVGRSYHQGMKTFENGVVRIIKVCEEIKDIARILDGLAVVWHRANQKRPNEIWITSALQPREKPSLHPYGRAIDIRIKDWDIRFRAIVAAFLLVWKDVDPDYHFQFEDESAENAHLHIQFGKLADAQREGLPLVTKDNVYT